MNHYSTHTVQILLPIAFLQKPLMKNLNLNLKVTHPNLLPHAPQSELRRNRVRDTCRNYWTTALDCLHQDRSALTSHHQLSTAEDAFTSKGWSSASAGSGFQWGGRGGILPRLYQTERKTSLPRSVSMETPAILEINLLPLPHPPPLMWLRFNLPLFLSLFYSSLSPSVTFLLPVFVLCQTISLSFQHKLFRFLHSVV